VGDVTPRPQSADVSVLLLSWNTKAFTLRCIDSLAAGADGLRLQVVVVENGSRDGSAEALRARPDIELIENEENVGYAAGVNQAFRRSTAPLVLLLNSDIVFEPGSLARLHALLEERPDVAGVGPMYLNPDGSEQQHHFRLPTFGMALSDASRLFAALPAAARQERRYRMLDADFSHPQPVEQPSASCLLLRRDLLPPGDLMDERYPIYFNDVDLCFRLREAGRTLWMTPEARVVHEHGASTRLLGGKLARQHIASHVLYLSRTQPALLVLLYRALVGAQKLAKLLLRHPDSLSPGDLWAALRGDPGPVPKAPVLD